MAVAFMRRPQTHHNRDEEKPRATCVRANKIKELIDTRSSLLRLIDEELSHDDRRKAITKLCRITGASRREVKKAMRLLPALRLCEEAAM